MITKIVELCPALKRHDFEHQHNAIVKMCIAHVMNGGEYIGFYETAIEYLEKVGKFPIIGGA